MAILVDTNIHVIALPHQRDKYPLNIYPGTESEFTEEQSNDPADFVKVMDEAGLDQAYLMASRFHGFDNSYCADAIAKFPDRFVGVANVDILSPDAPERITYWVKERGMHGVRFWGGGPVAGHRFPGDTRGRADYVDDPQCIPAWERILELDVPVNAQATMPEVTPNTRHLLERFPTLRFTLNNLIHVPAAEGADSEAAKDMLALSEFPNVYVNFSVNFMKQTLEKEAPKELFLAMLKYYGPRRLIWSSFGRRLVEATQIMREGVAFLSEEDQAGVLGEGARDLYPALRRGVATPA
jgi:predicted TIM-barrel fold metal-dependent hydrolase